MFPESKGTEPVEGSGSSEILTMKVFGPPVDPGEKGRRI